MTHRCQIRIAAILALAFVALVGAAATSLAQAPAKPQKAPAALLRGPYAPLLRQLQGLGLTQEQRQQVLGIFKAHQPDVKAVAEKMRAARTRWEQAGQIDIQERKALLAERQATMKPVIAEVTGVLTPEQQQKFEARRQRMARRFAK